MKYLGIQLTLKEIITFNKNEFKELLKKSIKEKTFQYLLGKRGNKSKEIKYQYLKIADFYLFSNNQALSISEK